MKASTAISEPTNGGKTAIDTSLPYIATVTVEGTADLLLHAWNVESIDAKSKAKKGSEAKKTDDIESYVRRNDDGLICLPSEYLRMAVVNAAKYRQDPRSPRKSAMDLYKAAIIGLEPLCVLRNAAGKTTDEWDYEHRCRVQVQRAGITRCRPAFKSGWTVQVPLLVNLPEYVGKQDLNEVIGAAGRLIGVGDFRPTYGRFIVTDYKIQQE
jgi:hypothetical protein